MNPPATINVTLGGGGRGGAPVAPSLNPDNSDIKSVVRAQLASLKNEVTAAAATISDPMSKYHLQDIAKRIDNALNPKIIVALIYIFIKKGFLLKKSLFCFSSTFANYWLKLIFATHSKRSSFLFDW